MVRLNKVERARTYAATAAGALRGFASAFKISVGEFDFGVTEPKTADSGNLEIDLPELLVTTAEAARAADTSVALFVDEVQYLSEGDLRGLIVALHRVAQEGLPLVLFGAGLPQAAALAGDVDVASRTSRHGPTRAGAPLVGCHRGRDGHDLRKRGAAAVGADQEGDDLQPEAWRDSVYRSDVRRVHAPGDPDRARVSDGWRATVAEAKADVGCAGAPAVAGRRREWCA